MKTLDVITIGRSSVDLYGAQVGGRLEDMGSFQKYVGGSPTNMATGTARLGLKSALITRVGDEHMGRFLREELAREGVDVRGVKTDPERLTALVLLGIGWNFMFVGATALLSTAHRPEERVRAQAANDVLVFGTVACTAFASSTRERQCSTTS
jgi:sugar/nucleoside kinase (ribokinase family)